MLAGWLISLAIGGLVFVGGLRLGKRNAGWALRVCLLAFAAVCAYARYQFATPNHEFQPLMLIGALAGLLLQSALVLLGPTVFERWLYALALSLVAITAFRVFAGLDVLMWMITGGPAVHFPA